jgi:4'-phosphopantetheinyl transferase
MLTPEEIERARRFHFERDGARFIAARGILRAILGAYLRCQPSLIRFASNEYGKPNLDGHKNDLRFNLSHSHGVALFACSRACEVGIDIERLRDDFSSHDIAARFFSRAELCAFNSVPTRLRTRAFFNCWTRKEAYIKATGKGLSYPLDTFTVSVDPREPARLISIDNNTEEPAKWSIININAFKGFAAALAIRHDNPELQCWHWRRKTY